MVDKLSATEGERMDDYEASGYADAFAEQYEDEFERAQEAQDSAEELGYGDEITTDEGEV